MVKRARATPGSIVQLTRGRKTDIDNSKRKVRLIEQPLFTMLG